VLNPALLFVTVRCRSCLYP